MQKAKRLRGGSTGSSTGNGLSRFSNQRYIEFLVYLWPLRGLTGAPRGPPFRLPASFFVLACFAISCPPVNAEAGRWGLGAEEPRTLRKAGDKAVSGAVRGATIPAPANGADRSGFLIPDGMDLSSNEINVRRYRDRA